MAEKKKPKGEKLKLLGNPQTKEVHNVKMMTGSCNIGEIKEVLHFKTMRDARAAGMDPCGWCYPHLSER